MNSLTIFILLLSIIVSVNADNDVIADNSCADDGCIAGLYCNSEKVCTACTGSGVGDTRYCPAGSTSNTGTACTQSSACSAGSTYLSGSCTASTTPSCTACTQCAAGQKAASACTVTANTGTCSNCAAGTARAGTTTTATSCDSCTAATASERGTYSAAGAASCTDCTQCAAGQKAALACTVTANTGTCTGCTSGKYQTSATSFTTSCTDHSAVCSAGTPQTAGSTTADRVCGTVCPASQYVAAAANAQTTTTCAVCAAGSITGVTGTGASTCTSCVAGSTYSTASNVAACSTCTNCVAGKYTATACIATADTVCTICAAHTYKDAADTAANTVTTCTNCPAGTDNTDAATAEGNHDAADDCTVCASSKYSVAGSACVDCPVGTSMAAHASDGVAYDGSNAGEHDSIIDCLICAAHSYQDTAGSASCDSCAAGKDLVNTYGGQACDEENVGSCADGTYTTKTACETAGETWTAACDATNGAPDSDEAADCTDCSAGKYGPGNFVECADCVLSNTATFGTDTGLTRNDDCAAATCDTGYVLSGDTPDRCNTCDTGYSVSGTACQCAIDYHVQSNQCVACATGTYKNAGDVFSGEDTECNSGGNTANRDAVPDAQGIEALEPDSEYMQKVVYSLGGSLHRNKYGYLVDNNGLLLIGEGKSSDQNAQHHLHVPSRYNEVYFDGNGKIWVVELNGAVYTNIGTITLARFEDPKGLNKYKSIKSRCIAEDNEFGFMLGSWCRDTWLDGLEIDYMDASLVSGPGIIGKPMDQGLGRIINGKKHEITSFLRGQFYKNKAPGWSIKIDGRGYFQFRYIVKKLTSADIRYDQGGTGDGTYNAAYLTGSTRI